MATDSVWLREGIPNPADITPRCRFCGKLGSCLMPLEINHKRRAVIATYRCENGHQWAREFRPERKLICDS
jgi:hypothetical protein